MISLCPMIEPSTELAGLLTFRSTEWHSCTLLYRMHVYYWSRLGHTNAGVRSVSWPEVPSQHWHAALFQLYFPIKALGSGNGLNLTAKRDALCYIVQEDRNTINDDLHLVSFSDLVLQSERPSPALIYIVLSASGTSSTHIVFEWFYATIAAVAGRWNGFGCSSSIRLGPPSRQIAVLHQNSYGLSKKLPVTISPLQMPMPSKIWCGYGLKHVKVTGVFGWNVATYDTLKSQFLASCRFFALFLYTIPGNHAMQMLKITSEDLLVIDLNSLQPNMIRRFQEQGHSSARSLAIDPPRWSMVLVLMYGQPSSV